MKRDDRGFDQVGDLVLAQNDRQMETLLRIRRFFNVPGSSQGLDIEEPQSADALVDGIVGKLAIAKQMGHVLADLFGTELVWRTIEIAREILNGVQVRTSGSLFIIPALKFFARDLSS